MSIIYKFKNELSSATVECAEASMTVHNVKVAILKQRHRGFQTSFDLDVISEDGKTLADFESVTRNSSVVVMRRPLEPGRKLKVWFEQTQDDAISQMCAASAEMYDPKHWVTPREPSRAYPPPPNYRCRKCHVAGHWVADCALRPGETAPKPTTGIPRTFLSIVSKDTPGARVGQNGLYMATSIERHAFENPRKEKPIWAEDEEPGKYEPKPPPKEFVCPGCDDLMPDCVRMPVCACAMCDNCARMSLLASDENACPLCGTTDNFLDHIRPHEELRERIYLFRNPKAARSSGSSGGSASPTESSGSDSSPTSDEAPPAEPEPKAADAEACSQETAVKRERRRREESRSERRSHRDRDAHRHRSSRRRPSPDSSRRPSYSSYRRDERYRRYPEDERRSSSSRRPAKRSRDEEERRYYKKSKRSAYYY